jgi:cytochrome c peroxidase
VRSLSALGAFVFAVGALALNPSVRAFAVGEGMVPDLATMKNDYRRPAEVPAPADNSYAPQRAELGKKLFFDPRLSGSGAISCASCHNPALSWEDGLPTGIGHMGNRLGRHSPTVEDLAWGGPYFWDGRAASLEDQAKGPLQSAGEMNMPLADVTRTVESMPEYTSAFAKAYPGEALSIDTIAKAIANYERTIVSGTAPFDRWIEGEEGALSEAAKHGFTLFNGKAGCAECHSGWRFTDDGFHDIGLKSDDLGRGALPGPLTTGNPVLQHAFKTPTLRNVGMRAPYMHDGSKKSLREVIDLYDGGFIERQSLSTHVKRLNLMESEKRDLVAFMQSLTGKADLVVLPVLPKNGE